MIGISTEERWALTFELKKYVDVQERGYNFEGALTNIAIEQSLKLLINNNICTPAKLSFEIKKCTGVHISSYQLKRYSYGIFEKLTLVSNDLKG